MEELIKCCAQCGCELEGEYLQVRDNYLLIHYFEQHKENRFCDSMCLARYLSADTVYIGDEYDYLDDDEKES